jgi:hypothetical protein
MARHSSPPRENGSALEPLSREWLGTRAELIQRFFLLPPPSDVLRRALQSGRWQVAFPKHPRCEASGAGARGPRWGTQWSGQRLWKVDADGRIPAWAPGTTGPLGTCLSEDVELRQLMEGVAEAGSWAVWMGVFSKSWMKLLVAGGLTFKRARIVTGEISAIITECRCAVAKVRHERAAMEGAEAAKRRQEQLEKEVRELTLGNRGQIKRRVHARTHARTHARAPLPPRPPPKGFRQISLSSSDNAFCYLCSLGSLPM